MAPGAGGPPRPCPPPGPTGLSLNAVLHQAGLTSDDPVFSTIPGVHLVRQADGSYARELRGPGDVSHVGWPPVEGSVPADVRELEHALEAIEQHRDPCLRGDRVPTRAIADECDAAFARVTAILAARCERGPQVAISCRPSFTST